MLFLIAPARRGGTQGLTLTSSRYSLIYSAVGGQV